MSGTRSSYLRLDTLADPINRSIVHLALCNLGLAEPKEYIPLAVGISSLPEFKKMFPRGKAPPSRELTCACGSTYVMGDTTYFQCGDCGAEWVDL